MAETTSTTKKPPVKTTRKRSPKKVAARPTAKRSPRSTTAATSSADIRKQITKLKTQLLKTQEKEINTLSKALVKEKKRLASHLAKVKIQKEKVVTAREAYRAKPTAATKNRYARARAAAKIVTETLADTRSLVRRFSEQITEANTTARREKKLQVAIDKLAADLDKPKKTRARKKRGTSVKAKRQPRQSTAPVAADIAPNSQASPPEEATASAEMSQDDS